VTFDPVTWPQAAVRITLILVIGLVLLAVIAQWGGRR
jgi:hypothetical protein